MLVIDAIKEDEMREETRKKHLNLTRRRTLPRRMMVLLSRRMTLGPAVHTLTITRASQSLHDWNCCELFHQSNEVPIVCIVCLQV